MKDHPYGCGYVSDYYTWLALGEPYVCPDNPLENVSLGLGDKESNDNETQNPYCTMILDVVRLAFNPNVDIDDDGTPNHNAQ